jgi:hypothetical protein
LFPHTLPALHSASAMQFKQSCCAPQTPLMQLDASLQPGTQVNVSVQYCPLGQ